MRIFFLIRNIRISAVWLLFCSNTLFTRAIASQELPRINPVLVAVVPFEADGVLAHGRDLIRLGGLTVHGQFAGFEFGGSAQHTSAAAALFIAQGAGTGIAQPVEAVAAGVTVFPSDFHACASSHIHLHRFGIEFGVVLGIKIWIGLRRHIFSIAQAGLTTGCTEYRKSKSPCILQRLLSFFNFRKDVAG